MIVIYCLLSSFLFRVRGGLRFWGHKAPLNKFWYAIFVACLGCIHFDWSVKTFLIGLIAGRLATQLYGWGEYVTCVLGSGKPSERSDCDLVDEIVDNLKVTIKGNTIKLTDYPMLFGWVGLSLRGLLITFIWGLFFQSIGLMLSGLSMGSVYWLAGWVNRHIRDDGKHGWRRAEWYAGLIWGIVFYFVLN